jgi:hypothetical protein
MTAASPVLTLVPKRSLFAHVAEVEDLASLVDQLDRAGELTDEAAEELSAALCASIAGTKTKVDRTAAVLAAFASAESAAKLERDRLDVRAKYFARQTERLEDYVLAVLSASQLERLDGLTATLARRKNPAKVVIDSEDAIPFEYLRFPPEPPPPPAVPDKAALKKALAAGPVDGCHLTQDYRIVRS